MAVSWLLSEAFLTLYPHAHIHSFEPVKSQDPQTTRGSLEFRGGRPLDLEVGFWDFRIFGMVDVGIWGLGFWG